MIGFRRAALLLVPLRLCSVYWSINFLLVRIVLSGSAVPWRATRRAPAQIKGLRQRLGSQPTVWEQFWTYFKRGPARAISK